METRTECLNTPVMIPDDSSTGITPLISFPHVGTILDINVDIDITHGYVFDLDVELQAQTLPSSPVLLFDSECLGSSYDDSQVTMDDEGTVLSCSLTPPAISGNLIPAEPLATFDGQPSNQVWTLVVRDPLAGDAGTLNSWCVTIEYEVP